MWNKHLKKIKASIGVLLCICIMTGSFAMVPLNQHGEVQHAEAQLAVLDGANLGANTQSAVFNSMSAVLQDFFYIKEFTLDGIASGLAKLILKSITQSILTWINSGFQGSPAFVTDLKQFLLDRADLAAGDFIYGSELGFLCSPFQLDVKIALATAYQQQEHEGFGSESQCTLSKVTDNVEGFLSGSFDQGGWASWFEVTQNPVNTPTGAYLAAEGEMYARIADEKGNTIKELEWGSGFLSFKVCGDTQVASGAQKNCTITTPGKVIEYALTVNLQNGTQALIEADEINEIIGALFAQLAKQAITGVSGLLGLGGGSQYSSNSFGDNNDKSYLDALAEENTISDGISNPFSEAIALSDEHVRLQVLIVASINEAETIVDEAIERHGTCIDLTLPQELINKRNEAVEQVLKAPATVEALLELNEVYLDSSNPEGQIEAIETYQNMAAAGLILNDVTVKQLDFYITFELERDIDTLLGEVSRAISRCTANGH